MRLWRWIKRTYQCQDCGGWNKSMFGNVCLNVETCPSWTRTYVSQNSALWANEVALADQIDGLIDEMFTDEAAAAEKEIRDLLWDNKVGIIRALQSLRARA